MAEKKCKENLPFQYFYMKFKSCSFKDPLNFLQEDVSELATHSSFSPVIYKFSGASKLITNPPQETDLTKITLDLIKQFD